MTPERIVIHHSATKDGVLGDRPKIINDCGGGGNPRSVPKVGSKVMPKRPLQGCETQD